MDDPRLIPPPDAPRPAPARASGRRIEPARLITHRFPVSRADQAYDLLDRRPQEAVQVMLTYRA